MATLPTDWVNTEREPSRADADLVDILDQYWEEGRGHREKQVPLKQRERDLKLYRGEVGPEKGGTYRYKLNLTQAFIDRQVAQLTDNRPILRIEARKEGLRPVAKAEEAFCRLDWDVCDMQAQTTLVAKHAALEGAAGLLTLYDRQEDLFSLRLLRLGDFVVDPAVTVAARVCSDAEYVVFREMWPMSLVRERFPLRGRFVQPDPFLDDLSTSNESASGGGRRHSYIRERKRDSDGALPRVLVYTYFYRDRQRDSSGDPLFPGGRQTIKAGDVILWDGPNTYWDGEWPLDVFEWDEDPDHIYGQSGVSLLRETQLSINEILNGTVEGKLFTNFVSLVADHDSLDQVGWNQLKTLTNTNIFKTFKRGARFEFAGPPPVVGDSIALVRALIMQVQMITGVTDVTLGESPGSLQSGLAIEGLQEGANLMTRYRAGRLENFYGRVGQKMIARHLQYLTGDRALALLGPHSVEAMAWAEYKVGFTIDEDGHGVTARQRIQALRDFKFGVLPGSSAPGTRRNRAMMMGALAEKGLVPGEMVLEAAEIPNAKEVHEQATKEMTAKAPLMNAMKSLGK